ncbi:hypothetical protein GHT06_012852 [Daphnia sinensis]|uniref:Uncharacterized protein n=1 Tax=Daphnia sinensis TaxID=1820382 RepID=A0AAD5LH26_9CRUS|nr:hypothetical protein GHT06_012852 [Daphnia sinensis]
MRNLLFLRYGQTDGFYLKGEEKETKEKKKKKVNEMWRIPTAITLLFFSRFADTIKSRLHLITTRGEVTNRTDSRHHRKGPASFFLFIYLTCVRQETGGMRDGRGADCVIFIYNTTVCLNDPSSRSLAFNSPFRQFHIQPLYRYAYYKNKKKRVNRAAQTARRSWAQPSTATVWTTAGNDVIYGPVHGACVISFGPHRIE